MRNRATFLGQASGAIIFCESFKSDDKVGGPKGVHLVI